MSEKTLASIKTPIKFLSDSSFLDEVTHKKKKINKREMDASGTPSSSKSKLLNPWVLNFQKLALEFKCPLCLSYFKRPVLLPCNHLFCNSCLADCKTAGSECAVCNTKYTQLDVRHVPFVENMVTIYRSLDATFSASLFHQHSSACRNMDSDKAVAKLRNSDDTGAGKNHKSKMSGAGGREDCGVVEMDVNRSTHSAPDSAPFCDTKGSDNDCSDQDSGHPLPSERLENSSLKRTSSGNVKLKEKMSQLRSESSASETEGLTRELKRQKDLTHGNDQLRTVPQNGFVDFRSDIDLKSGKEIGTGLPSNSDDSFTSASICSFCQSSKSSEATGPMLHYANGKLVSGDAAQHPNVIHVHRVCIDWAPQVYFIGETCNNLKAEVARGAKLKCTKCGLKGAALGCYVKSCRRTYHVPCAMDIPDCRWDHGDFLLLCAAHSHFRFPTEKTKSKKQATHKNSFSSHPPSENPSPLGASQADARKLVFCGSALSAKDKVLLINFASKVGATVTKCWSSNVTHVIAATNENGACSRTLKVLMAILNGRWILKMDWVKACMEVMNPVEEEPYEISLDNQGCHGGPKAGRLRALGNEPKLFSGLKFYFSGDYVAAFRDDLEDLVEGGGGTILRCKEEFEVKKDESDGGPSKVLVVYNLDPPPGCKLGEEVSILWQRLNDAEDIAAKTGSQVIGHTWILESIAACKLQPFVT